jgi:pilus assembly protein FimV
LKTPEVEEVAPSVDFSVDLPEIELDSAAVPMPAADGGDADDPEVATKLELAQAYEEMGDREGARELLNEVLSEGSAAQQATARSRLEQLAV